MKKRYNVTQTRMPEREEFYARISTLFETAYLTNHGSCVQELESALQQYLDVPYLLSCNNGTNALMLALQCAGLAGKKVAITPYTYVATLSALLWIGCTPVFVDVDAKTLCISPSLLKQTLQEHPDIAGIMAVHIYGIACNVEELENICNEFNVSLIYDGAQAFGSEYLGKSLLSYGDYSICSFHATKIFHTAEGGCVIAHNKQSYENLFLARAFGHIGDKHYSLGINAKMSELHAALGLSLLTQTKNEIVKRKEIFNLYNCLLQSHPLQLLHISENLNYNYAYYPIFLPTMEIREKVLLACERLNIFPRRYFYPALNTLPYLDATLKTKCPVAEDASNRVLCLPCHGNLEHEAVEIICRVLIDNL